jgi:hypothetical protein
MVIGALSSIATTVVTYYFGSSESSARKNEIFQGMKEKNNHFKLLFTFQWVLLILGPQWLVFLKNIRNQEKVSFSPRIKQAGQWNRLG